jgi:hypothetical protein
VLKAAKAFLGMGIFVFGLASLFLAYGDDFSNEADQEAVLTNSGLLRLTVEEAIEGVCDRLPLLEPKVLCLSPESDAPGNWMVEHALIQSLHRRSFRILIPDTSGGLSNTTCEDEAILRYRLMDLNLLYPSVQRKHLFGPRFVARQARLNVLLRLDGSEGEVLWTEEVRGTREDWIPAKMLAAVEQEPISFISPQLKADGWNRFAEPALLSAVVGGLIYLFYATQ